MADHQIAAGGSSDDVARFLALTERQHELWTLLRDAEDDEVRNQVFDELTANRQEIDELKGKADARGEELAETPARRNTEAEQPARSVGEQLRAQIVTQPERVAPAQPPPPPSPPPGAMGVPTAASAPSASASSPNELARTDSELDPAADPTPEPERPEPAPTRVDPIEAEPTELESPVPEPEPEDQASPVSDAPPPEPEAPDPEPQERLRDAAAPQGLAPEPTPYRSRADDIAALRRQLASKEKRGPKVSDEVLAKRRRAAHDRYQSISRVRPQPSRVFPIIAIIVALAAVGLVVWFTFFYGTSSDIAAPPVTVTTTTTTTTAAPVAPPEDIVAAIQEAVAALEVGAIGVTEQVGTIVLSGYVNAESERQAVIDTVQSLAGSKPVDTSRLELTPTDEEVRAAVEQALGSDSFDAVEVSTTNGIAVLTGVVDADDREALTGAVAAVDGVARVVDATRTRNAAAELAAAVRRIGGPNPIVYESGQLDLTDEQRGTLDGIAEAILANPGPYVTVVGYTDPAGGSEGNRQISQVRADLVRNYLVGQGVPGGQVVAVGRGEDVPAGITLPVGLERRIEFEIGYAVPPAVVADFRIGVVAPSGRNDYSFTQSIVQSADLLAADRERVRVDITGGTTDEAAAAALRSYGASGYDLIIAHGAGYGEAVSVVASEYPGIAFVWGPGSGTFDLPNVSAYDVAAEEGAYVMGAIAASVSSSDAVGVVGSLESAESMQYVDAFSDGLVATKPGIEVLTTYTGSTSDVELATAAAEAHVAAGADVLTGTDAMAIGAISAAAGSNTLWFGNQVDQSALAEGLVVASQVYHWEVALRQIVTGIDEGTLGGQVYTINLGNGGLAIAYNPSYALALDVIIAADTISSEIISGALVIGG